MPNTLYFRDNLPVLREHIAAESVDLVYLDPPFNSNANCNILFKSSEGADSDARGQLGCVRTGPCGHELTRAVARSQVSRGSRKESS